MDINKLRKLRKIADNQLDELDIQRTESTKIFTIKKKFQITEQDYLQSQQNQFKKPKSELKSNS